MFKLYLVINNILQKFRINVVCLQNRINSKLYPESMLYYITKIISII